MAISRKAIGMETLYTDASTHYTIADAFAYIRQLPPSGRLGFPAAVRPLVTGVILALIISVVVVSLRPVKRRLVEAELDRPRKGKKYLFVKIMLALCFAWVVFWVLNPWSNITPFVVLINVGAVGFFVLMALLYAILPSPRDWDIDVEQSDEFDEVYCDEKYEEENFDEGGR